MSLPVVELAAIHAEFADPILYTGAGLDAGELPAIFSDEPAAVFQGAGATARMCSFEIRWGDLPGTPAKGDTIVHDGVSWIVIDRTNRRDVRAWVLYAETEIAGP